ncbi:UNKNOWN [Stylonychia lemnae]|uniref:Uncharacterized protein n=1 Tax=Stylonychia lemnae TaxID=5949 RepID=A0A078A6N7_STYLE|nr:UNKNOWN [Stylonychia lemnae]|eukprot:CDW77551.1 UNKNOWN [Stylonychia lemnae]
MAGSKLKLRLPDYFDPNPQDKVAIRVQTLNKYPQILITLQDDNKKPLKTEYLIYATFIPNDEGQINNTNIKNLNISKIDIRQAFGLDDQISFSKISPLGIIQFKFEKSINQTMGKTQLLLLIQNAIEISTDNPFIKLQPSVEIQIYLKNPSLFIFKTISPGYISIPLSIQINQKDYDIILGLAKFFNSTIHFS